MSSTITTSSVSYRNTQLQNFYQLNSFTQAQVSQCHNSLHTSYAFLTVSLFNHLQPTKSIYIEPVQCSNLNLRYILGLELEMSITVVLACFVMYGCGGFVMCGCFGNTCTCVYCVLYCLYCVFVLFRLCIFILTYY